MLLKPGSLADLWCLVLKCPMATGASSWENWQPTWADAAHGPTWDDDVEESRWDDLPPAEAGELLFDMLVQLKVDIVGYFTAPNM